MPAFEMIFHSNNPTRDKFLSRIFGIFNEEIVRCWCNDPRAPYENLGRPTITREATRRGRTLDFTFRSRNGGHVYIGEMKCWLEFENYRYLALESSSQLNHLTDETFRLFLDAAKEPDQYQVTVKGKLRPIDGAILVWGKCTERGRVSVIERFGLHTVLSLEEITTDLVAQGNERFLELLDQREKWCKELFDGLRRTSQL